MFFANKPSKSLSQNDAAVKADVTAQAKRHRDEILNSAPTSNPVSKNLGLEGHERIQRERARVARQNEETLALNRKNSGRGLGGK